MPRLHDADVQIIVGTMWRHNRTGELVLVSGLAHYGEYPYVQYRQLDGRLYGQDEHEDAVAATSFWYTYTQYSRDVEHTLTRAGVWLDDQPTLDTGEGIGTTWVHRTTRDAVTIVDTMVLGGVYPYVKLNTIQSKFIDRKKFQQTHVRGYDPIHMLSCATERPEDRKKVEFKPSGERVKMKIGF